MILLELKQDFLKNGIYLIFEREILKSYAVTDLNLRIEN